MISAVDLLKGIAVGAGMRNIEVPGANGGLNTNYEGKAEAGVKALLEEGADFVYIHVEAPDEMGHQGSVERKVKAIEYLDSKGVFLISKSGIKVCELFNISKFTLYNYLEMIRNKHESAERNGTGEVNKE